MTARRHNPNMNDTHDELDQRMRRAAPDVSAVAAGDTDLSSAALSGRKGRAVNPRSVRRAALGSGAGVASLAVAAVVVTSIQPTPEPLFSLAQGGGGVSAEMSASDMRVGWWAEYVYTAGEGLDSRGGRGPVYQLVLDGDPQSVAARVAAQFGLEGDTRQSQYFDENYPTYVVGSEDWTAPTVSVTWTGTGSWYYSNPAAYPEPVCRETPGPEGSKETYYECENPVPTGALPSDQEAKSQAAEIFRATGLEIDPANVRVLSRDEWGLGVSAALVVDGVETALEWSIYWAPGPVLASASGHSVAVVDRGEFETVSQVAAVDRLASGVWWGSPGPAFYTFDAVARTLESSEAVDPNLPVTSDPLVPESPAEEGAPEPEPVPEPAPLEPDVLLEPEVIELTVSSAEATLLLVWDANGNAWLVPGYVMRYAEDDWGWVSVISVIEGIIAIPEPLPIDIMPLPEPFVG